MLFISHLVNSRASFAVRHSIECIGCIAVGSWSSIGLTGPIRPRCTFHIDWIALNMSINLSLYCEYSLQMTFKSRDSVCYSFLEDEGDDLFAVIVVATMLESVCSLWDNFYGALVVAIVDTSSLRRPGTYVC